MSCTVVIPTLGRPSLHRLLAALGGPARAADPDRSRPAALSEVAEEGDRRDRSPARAFPRVIVVDDRRERSRPLDVPGWAIVLPGPARGPAAARNAGWRSAATEWVAFVDDDVLPEPGWLDRLAEDLTSAPATVGGVQGRVRVPLPADRPPTDWEAVTAGLADGRWITADMAYRRAALAAAGGFDERLPRAFREDAELACRVRRAGWVLCRGERWVTHPVRPEGPWVSVRTQRGNADDALLRRLYGPHWRFELDVPPGRRRRHAAIVAAGGAAVACGLAAVIAARRDSAEVTKARRGPAGRGLTGAAGLAAAAWAAGTAEFAGARIRSGPRDRREVAVMLATSVAIPPVAVVHWLRGWLRWRGATPITVARTSENARPAAEATPTPQPALGRAGAAR